MALLQLPGTKLLVRYLYENNGRPYFQIRVPEDLRERFGNRYKISRPLPPDEGAPFVQVQRLAKSHKALFKAMRSDPHLSPHDEKLAALALLERYQLSVGDGKLRLDPWDPAAEYDDQPHLAPLLDELLEASRERSLEAHERLALKALQGPLPTSLSELLEVYLDSHTKRLDKDFRETQSRYWQGLINLLGDIPVETLDRSKAHKYVEARLGQYVSQATVQKEVKIISAVLSAGFRELGMTQVNPFSSLSLPSGVGKPSERRLPFTLQEHRAVIREALKADDEIRTIVLVTALTGCRIGEAVGLRKSDCVLDYGIPHIVIEEYGVRSLKTSNSIRKVPLLPTLETALRRQFNRAEGSLAMFPSYNDMTKKPKADGASASVNKWLKSKCGIAKTSHSFRHSVTDLLRNAQVPEELRREITGGTKQYTADRYGEGQALEHKLAALTRAFFPIFEIEC